MKRNAPVKALAVLLCGVLLLSGTLLVLHSGHSCQDTSCTLCPIIDGFIKMLLGAIASAASLGLVHRIRAGRCYGPPENRYEPEWTLVQQKVKLLN